MKQFAFKRRMNPSWINAKYSLTLGYNFQLVEFAQVRIRWTFERPLFFKHYQQSIFVPLVSFINLGLGRPRPKVLHLQFESHCVFWIPDQYTEIDSPTKAHHCCWPRKMLHPTLGWSIFLFHELISVEIVGLHCRTHFWTEKQRLWPAAPEHSPDPSGHHPQWQSIFWPLQLIILVLLQPPQDTHHSESSATTPSRSRQPHHCSALIGVYRPYFKQVLLIVDRWWT